MYRAHDPLTHALCGGFWRAKAGLLAISCMLARCLQARFSDMDMIRCARRQSGPDLMLSLLGFPVSAGVQVHVKIASHFVSPPVSRG